MGADLTCANNGARKQCASVARMDEVRLTDPVVYSYIPFANLPHTTHRTFQQKQQILSRHNM
jgi:hypothetical protein